jgi:hypothetical protein
MPAMVTGRILRVPGERRVAGRCDALMAAGEFPLADSTYCMSQEFLSTGSVVLSCNSVGSTVDRARSRSRRSIKITAIRAGTLKLVKL